jgi:hypothetical protein
MMAEPTSILIENLKDTLKGAQWYFMSGSVTALFILLLAVRGELAAGAAEQEVKVPFLELTAPTFGAAFIALAIYILSGWMLFGFISHIRRIKGELTRLNEKEVLDATLTYPSMLTTGRYTPVATTLLVAFLGTLALLASYYANQGFSSALMTGLIASHPYFIVAFSLWRVPLYEPSKIG